MQIEKGSKWRWKGEEGHYFTKGRAYEVLSTGKPGELFRIEDDTGRDGAPHHWTNDASFFEHFERVGSPVRTITRKEILYGVFGKVMANEDPRGGTLNSIAMAPTKDPAELRAAASTLIEIADALESPTK